MNYGRTERRRLGTNSDLIHTTGRGIPDQPWLFFKKVISFGPLSFLRFVIEDLLELLPMLGEWSGALPM